MQNTITASRYVLFHIPLTFLVDMCVYRLINRNECNAERGLDVVATEREGYSIPATTRRILSKSFLIPVDHDSFL